MSQHRRTIIRVVAGLLLAVSIHHFADGAYESRRFGFVDFPIFLQQAALFADGRDLYVDPALPDAYEPAAAVYKFPPLFAALLLPFVRAAPTSVYVGHWWLQLALYAAAVGLLLAAIRTSRRPVFVVGGLLLALNFEPFFETLWRLQLETPILLLLAVALVAASRRRDLVAGAALGLAIALKIYPGFLLLYFLVRRRFKVVAAALACGLAVQLGTLIVLGGETHRVFFLDVLPVLLAEAPVATSENVGLARYALLLFGGGAGVAKRVAQAVVLLLTVATLVAVERNRRDGIDRGPVELAAMIPLMLLSTPNSWVNYQLLLLPPLLVLLARFGERRTSAGTWAAFGLACGLLLFYAPCAGPEMGWPCTRTPALLGIHALPRSVHDLFVDLRGLATLLVWGLASFVVGDRAVGNAAAPGNTAPPA